MSTTRVEELIEEFDRLDEEYKHDEVEEAISIREEVTPALIAILEEIATDPNRYAQEAHFANGYAVAMLAHFQEPAAHLPAIRAFSIPEEQLEMVWGDMVTMTLPALLIQTCNGDLEAIRELILNRQAQEFVRGAAIEAICYAVAKGMADRVEVIDFLAGLLTGTEAEEGSSFWGNVVCTISELHPEGAMEPIRKAFAEGLVTPDYVTLREIEQDLAREREVVLSELRATMEHRIPQDVHDYLSWFSCFQYEPLTPPPPINSAIKSQQNRKYKTRTRNKQAKKSRKKNRR